MDIVDPAVRALKRRWGLLLCGTLFSCAISQNALPRHRGANSDPTDPGAWAALRDNFPGPEGAVERYYSKVIEKAEEKARNRASQRLAVEEAASMAAVAAQAGADEVRRKIASATYDPDDSPELAARTRQAALAAFDVKTSADVAAARQKVIDDARESRRYVDEAQAEEDFKATREALDAAIDEAYTDGVVRAVEDLNAEYELAGNPRRTYAENESGYAGSYYKLDRVDRYFAENWKGENQAVAVEKCKATLGFAKGSGDGSNFKDPSVENVDKLCGIREGLIALLASYRGRNKPSHFDGKDSAPSAATAEAENSP
jgi:hypothetical protein